MGICDCCQNRPATNRLEFACGVRGNGAVPRPAWGLTADYVPTYEHLCLDCFSALYGTPCQSWDEMEERTARWKRARAMIEIAFGARTED